MLDSDRFFFNSVFGGFSEALYFSLLNRRERILRRFWYFEVSCLKNQNFRRGLNFYLLLFFGSASELKEIAFVTFFTC